jgi:hypothetical protein
MQSESKTVAMKKSSNRSFGLGVLSPDSCHHLAASSLVYDVHPLNP